MRACSGDWRSSGMGQVDEKTEIRGNRVKNVVLAHDFEAWKRPDLKNLIGGREGKSMLIGLRLPAGSNLGVS